MGSRFDAPNKAFGNRQEPKKTPEVNNEEELNINNTNYLNLVKREEPEINDWDIEWKYGNVYNCSAVNLRKNPNVDSKIIMEIPNGTEIQFIEIDNMDWVKVKYKDNFGYCMFDYINAEN